MRASNVFQCCVVRGCEPTPTSPLVPLLPLLAHIRRVSDLFLEEHQMMQRLASFAIHMQTHIVVVKLPLL